jgi:hypothetical protein
MRYRGLGVGLVLLGLSGAIVARTFDFRPDCGSCWLFRGHRHNYGERNPSTSLKTITSAQADFRANDRDGDGVNQFWRADIAGLYALAPGGGPAMRLIERCLALADARPVYDLTREGERTPLQGYWYRAIRHADEKTIDAASQFAAVAYPADYPKSGKYTFIVDENYAIFRADLGHGKGLEVYPTDDELRTKWSKLD